MSGRIGGLPSKVPNGPLQILESIERRPKKAAAPRPLRPRSSAMGTLLLLDRREEDVGTSWPSYFSDSIAIGCPSVNGPTSTSTRSAAGESTSLPRGRLNQTAVSPDDPERLAAQ
jgi:hypothetical protein